MNPIIKWAGGKRRLIDQILDLFPDKFNDIIEPFAGSAAVSLQFPEKFGVVCDINKPLTFFHATVAMSDPGELTEKAAELDDEYNSMETMAEREEMYYEARVRFNRYLSMMRPGERVSDEAQKEIAMLFWFLNKTGYNGLYRVNKKGQFNVPFGKRKKLRLANHDIPGAHDALKTKVIGFHGFRTSIMFASPGDVLYADPPYYKENFTAYTANGFSERDHRDLASELFKARKRGVYVVVSNSDCPFVRELYRGMDFHEVEGSTSISRSADGRGGRSELLIVGRP
jgi:DNA adenine methylase